VTHDDSSPRPPALPRGLIVLLGSAGAVVAVAGIHGLADILAPVFLALMLVIAFSPLQTSLEARGLPRWLATVGTLLLLNAVLIGLVLTLAVSAARLATTLPAYADQAEDLVDSLQQGLRDMGIGSEEASTISQQLDLSAVLDILAGLLGAFAGIFSNVVFLLAVAFFPVTAAGQALLPITPVQILWINLVAAVALGLPLAFEAKEPDIMSRPPLDPKRQILDRFVFFRTVLVGLLMTAGAVGIFVLRYFGASGGDLAEAQTAAVTTVILFQIFYLLECRSLRGSSLEIGLFSNRWIYAGIGAILILQLGFVYLPFMNVLFGSAPLSLAAWGQSLLVGALVLPVVGLEKAIRERRRRSTAHGSPGERR